MTNSPCVQTTSGLMQGCMQDDVCCYLGIPYAKPPVGALRFLPPEKADVYEGVYDATFFRDSPVQFRGGAASPPYRLDQQNQPALLYSEDCLYLNVWAPERHEQPLPVVYWIYGGAYAMGSSSMQTYDGTEFAKKGAVVVSVNYRVGIFGFLAHPMLDTHAPYAYNAGLWDLIKGLEWVRGQHRPLWRRPTERYHTGRVRWLCRREYAAALPAGEGTLPPRDQPELFAF